MIVTVVDSAFQTDSVTTTIAPGALDRAGCEPELSAGTLRARAACIRRAGDVYTLEPGAITRLDARARSA